MQRLALATAMRAIAMAGDPETYRQRLNDFQLGYLAGHARALRRAREAQLQAYQAGRQARRAGR